MGNQIKENKDTYVKDAGEYLYKTQKEGITINNLKKTAIRLYTHSVFQ